MPTKADARIVVDRLLREAGWDMEDKSQVSTEEPAADGRADYLLRNQRTQPLAPIETKRFSIDPYSARERAREYAVSLTGSAQPTIPLHAIRRLVFPVPPPSEQLSIVARLDALAAKQAESRRLQTETEAELASFTPALLAKAFRREL